MENKDNLCAKDIMTKDVFTVSSGKSFNYVEVCAEAIHIRHIPVTDDKKKIIGIVSTRDLLQHLTVAGSNQFMPVDELMHTRIVTAAPDSSVTELAGKMLEHDVSCIPILENEEIIGIVTERDFLKLFS